MHIRPAQTADLPDLMRLLRLKADFDGCPEALKATPDQLQATLFTERPLAYVLLVELMEGGDRLPVSFASYHFTYSTFLARPSLWLDDLFVKADYRNQAIGTRLIQKLHEIALNRGCGRIDWTVNVNNAAGIRFYERMGGKLQTQVHLCRIDLQRNQPTCHKIAVPSI